MDTLNLAHRYMRGETIVRDRSSPRRNAERDRIMKMIISKPGFARVIGEHIGRTPQAIAAWNQVPIKYVKEVSDLLGMSPQEIRPDFFNDPRLMK